MGTLFDPPRARAGEARPPRVDAIAGEGIWLARDDLYDAFGASGGKARTCRRIIEGSDAELVVTASSRHSPQAIIVARIAQGLGRRARIHCPSGAETSEMRMARAAGAEIVQHRPGYNSVIVKRAAYDAAECGACEVPFGMECWEAVEETARAACALELPAGVRRVVIAVGSGMSFAGLYHGLNLPLLGIVVGADPRARLDKYAQGWWTPEKDIELRAAPQAYDKRVLARVGGVQLDPVYEAKVKPYLRPGDLFWIVGIRANAKEET